MRRRKRRQSFLINKEAGYEDFTQWKIIACLIEENHLSSKFQLEIKRTKEIKMIKN